VSTSAGTGTAISPSSAQVSSGGSTSFTVTLESGYDTLVVSGCGGSLVGNTYTTGAITADCTVTAGATGITYTVSTSSGTGVASLSCNDSTVTYGGSTTCIASLATGYETLTLSGCSGTAGGSPYSTGAIYADCTVSASASQTAYTVSTSEGTGTTLSPSSASVSYDTTTWFTAGTTGGYTNLSVSGCFGGSLSGSTFTTGRITADCTVTSFASPPSNGVGNGLVTLNTVCVQNSNQCGFSVTATTSPAGLCTMSPASDTATATSTCSVTGGLNSTVTINLVVNPNKNHCTGSGSTSSSNYAPQITLTPSTPNVTVRVELTNGAGNCNNGPSITYSP